MKADNEPTTVRFTNSSVIFIQIILKPWRYELSLWKVSWSTAPSRTTSIQQLWDFYTWTSLGSHPKPYCSHIWIECIRVYNCHASCYHQQTDSINQNSANTAADCGYILLRLVHFHITLLNIFHENVQENEQHQPTAAWWDLCSHYASKVVSAGFVSNHCLCSNVTFIYYMTLIQL